MKGFQEDLLLYSDIRDSEMQIEGVSYVKMRSLSIFKNIFLYF